jgi:alpha-amylase
LQQARQHLYAAQCNCAYWHGVFGGLYLSHLRRAVYAHLIAAEELVNRLRGPRVSMAVLDEDGDGAEEVHVTTPAMRLIVNPSAGGTVDAWHLYAPRLNLLDTLSRRPEPYHSKLKARQESPVATGGTSPASIHDALGVKEEHLEHHLIYDDHRRVGFIDYALQGRPGLHDVARSTWGERRLWSSGPYRLLGASKTRKATGPLSVRMERAVGGAMLRKSIRVWPNRPVAEYRYEVEGATIPVVALEFNLSLRDERYLQGPKEHGVTDRFTVEEPSAGARIEVEVDPAGELYSFPIETVSESEQGLERTYQGLALVWLWNLQGAREWSGRLRWSLGG